MSERNCASCKHWDEDEYNRGTRRCLAVPMYWEATTWHDDEGMARVFKPEFLKTTAFAQDGSDYSASLYTKAEHYCSMYEEAP